MGKYIWKNKDSDIPITVIGSLGIGPDGREYVKILESESGVPIDEIKKEPSESNSRKPLPRRLF